MWLTVMWLTVWITNLVTYLEQNMTKNKAIDCDAIGKVYDIYNKKNIPLDNNHLIT